MDPEAGELGELPQDPLGDWSRRLLGLYFVLLPILLVSLAAVLWPTSRSAPTPINPSATVTASIASDGLKLPIPTELSLILLVIVTGALGSYVHSATSFADYAGNRRLASSWVWWYVLRTFVGLSLALIFYFVVRGGLLSGGASASDLNPFGVAAVSGLVGMFSKQGTDKLRELFDTLFKTERPVARSDKLGNPLPGIQGIMPTSGAAGSDDVDLVITGNGFIQNSIVRFKGQELPTTYVSPTELQVRVPATVLAAPGAADVTVFNPPPGGGTAGRGAIFLIE